MLIVLGFAGAIGEIFCLINGTLTLSPTSQTFQQESGYSDEVTGMLTTMLATFRFHTLLSHSSASVTNWAGDSSRPARPSHRRKRWPTLAALGSHLHSALLLLWETANQCLVSGRVGPSGDKQSKGLHSWNKMQSWNNRDCCIFEPIERRYCRGRDAAY